MAKKKKWKAFNDLSKSLDTPIKPEFTIASLRSVLDNDAVVVADPGTPCPYFSAYYNFIPLVLQKWPGCFSYIDIYARYKLLL